MTGWTQSRHPDRTLNIAVVGSGIAGMSAAWLLSRRHRVTMFEADGRIGGHSNTVLAGDVPVDTGFIVFNEPAYPNLTALFRHIGVETADSDMSFAVSLDDGRLEYSGGGLRGLLAQPSNLLRPRFWSMLRDLARFFRSADAEAAGELSLDQYLDRNGYGPAFRENHLYPMASAIWSTPAGEIGQYPAASFIRFCANHGLLKFTGRPVWKTVRGGSRCYVERLTAPYAERIVLNAALRHVRSIDRGVELADWHGHTHQFDHVVLACHADQALRLLAAPAAAHRDVLGAFRYTRNLAVLHADASLMPRRRATWSAWNYLANGSGNDRRLTVTYWMNRLQPLATGTDLFVTLNPLLAPRSDRVFSTHTYEHPVFDAGAIAAQRRLWALQGHGNIWFCGAYFGHGFHEDGLQSGLAVAEQLGDMRRPWSVPHESGRIHLGSAEPMRLAEAAE